MNPAVCGCVCPSGTVLCQNQCRADCPPGQVREPRSCRCACPPGITCHRRETFDPLTCTCICRPGDRLDTVTVPVDGASVLSSLTLQSGVTYTLRASGTFATGVPPLDRGDAEYAYDSANPGLLASTRNSCGPGGNNVDIGIAINDTNLGTTKLPNWGPYTTAHVYTVDVIGSGAPISFSYHDCNAGDNRGSLRVEIFCPGP